MVGKQAISWLIIPIKKHYNHGISYTMILSQSKREINPNSSNKTVYTKDKSIASHVNQAIKFGKAEQKVSNAQL